MIGIEIWFSWYVWQWGYFHNNAARVKNSFSLGPLKLRWTL